jgi:hypothetical protein
VHLAPEDPRRVDLERHALSKLRRAMRVSVDYVSTTSTGLFEQAKSGYGEIVYDLGGRRATSRATSAEAVLETIYDLAGVSPPAAEEETFHGHPLAVPPRGAALVFYAAWPAMVGTAAYLSLRRPS